MEPSAVPPAPAAGATSILADRRRLIGRHFYTYTRVRALVAAIIVAAACFARYVLDMQTLRVRDLVFLAGWIVLYDVVAWALFRRYRDPGAPGETYERILGITYGAVVLDFLSLSVALWLVGGGRSPFVAFYLLHVMVSCVLLSRAAALTLTTLAYALLALLITVEWSGLAQPPLPVEAVAGAGPLGSRYALTLLVVYGTLFSFSTYLLLTLTRSHRRAQSRVLLAHDQLQRLSEQRKSFLHIAVHDLKAPVGAVTMLLDNLKAGLAGDTTEKQREWIDRCLHRLGDLTGFMTDLQTLSSLETDIVATEFARVDLTAIIRELVVEYRDVAESQRHKLAADIRLPVPAVLGHERLLREALVNYLTNAIKYTPDGGSITVRVRSRPPVVRVEVIDSGIGIDDANQARLFREFVRVPPRDRNAPLVKGSGLGLSIVKRIAQAHGGSVGVESRADQGSTFFLEIPELRE